MLLTLAIKIEQENGKLQINYNFQAIKQGLLTKVLKFQIRH